MLIGCKVWPICGFFLIYPKIFVLVLTYILNRKWVMLFNILCVADCLLVKFCQNDFVKTQF